MKIREVIVQDDETVGDSGTEIIDLNVLDPITELILRYQVKNSTATANDVPPEVTVTKIEITDGGQTYWSLAGEEAVAAACFDTGKWPPCWYNETLSATQRMNFRIPFGRFLGDTQFAFNPTSLRNPQLKITYAKDTLHLTGYVKIGLIARVMEGGPAPSQCLMWKEVENFSSAASGVKNVDMPVDYPYRRMLIRNFISSEVMSGTITHFKMTCDVDKFILFDMDESELSDICESMFGPFTMRKLDMFDQAGESQVWMGGKTVMSAQTNSAESFVQAYLSANSRSYQQALKWDGTNRTDAATDCLIWGFFPHCCRAYQFGLNDDPETWFNAPEFAGIEVKLTQACASVDCTVAVQQPRSLP